MKSYQWIPRFIYGISAVLVGGAPLGAGAAGLRIEVITAYNLVVDSNIESPSTCTLRMAYRCASVQKGSAI